MLKLIANICMKLIFHPGIFQEDECVQDSPGGQAGQGQVPGKIVATIPIPSILSCTNYDDTREALC